MLESDLYLEVDYESLLLVGDETVGLGVIWTTKPEVLCLFYFFIFGHLTHIAS